MAQFTNTGENIVADWMRSQGLGSLPASFWIGLASAASDGSITELTGTGYARQEAPRDLATWAGTQGAGSVLASSGATHQTSNNITLNFGTAGSNWGTATHAVIFTASSGGSALSYHTLTPSRSITTGAPVTLAPGDIVFTIGITGISNYLVNKFIDAWFRGQAFTFPALGYFALFTSAPTNAGGGTEINVGSYARASTPFTLAGFSGTQGAGTTTASSGTGGIISNNLEIAFPQPSADQGTATHEGVYDAAIAGNLLFWNPLATARTILSGSDPQKHAPGSWSITVA